MNLNAEGDYVLMTFNEPIKCIIWKNKISHEPWNLIIEFLPL